MCIYIVYISGSLWNFCIGVLWSRPPFGLSLPVTASYSEHLYTLGEKPWDLAYLSFCVCLILINTLSSRSVLFFSADGLLFFLFMCSSTSCHVHTKLLICSLALSCALWAALQWPSLHRHLWIQTQLPYHNYHAVLQLHGMLATFLKLSILHFFLFL